MKNDHACVYLEILYNLYIVELYSLDKSPSDLNIYSETIEH
jgi:hypothetical protein